MTNEELEALLAAKVAEIGRGAADSAAWSAARSAAWGAAIDRLLAVVGGTCQ